MDREIKFRAWDGKQMIHLESKWWCNEYASLAFECKENSDICGLSHLEFEEDKAILMQYTGLKDKNGKEIYEGDVLRYLDGNKNTGKYKEVAGGNYVVYSDIYKYRLRRTDTKRYVQHVKGIGGIQNETGKWEIIGNVMENPELISNTENI